MRMGKFGFIFLCLIIILSYASCGNLDKPVGCFLKPKTGPCKAGKPRWYYNPKTQTCKRFIFGGCRANFNNFKLNEDCLKTCSPLKG